MASGRLRWLPGGREMEARWLIGCMPSRRAERSLPGAHPSAKAAKLLFPAMLTLAGAPPVVLAGPGPSGWVCEAAAMGERESVSAIAESSEDPRKPENPGTGESPGTGGKR